MSADKEIMGRFALDGAEGIAFHVYDTEISDDYDDPSCVTEVKFGELEKLVEFLRYNFPGLFVATPPADDVRDALHLVLDEELSDVANLIGRDGVQRIAERIATEFEIRPRVPVTDHPATYDGNLRCAFCGRLMGLEGRGSNSERWVHL